MSQSKDAVQLCALLVDETYGELASRIFTILLRRGRLSLQNLAQHTRLNRRQLHHGLVVLIQQNLIYYSEEGSQATNYEANQAAAYALARSGKILEVVESRYGNVARDVVQNMFLLGHAKIGQLIESYQLNKKSSQNGANDDAPAEFDAQSYSPAKLDSILYTLLEVGMIQTVTHMSFRSPADTYNEIEQDIVKAEFTGGTKGTKQKEMLKAMIRDKLEALRLEGQNWKPKGNKRKLEGAAVNGTNGSAKRRRFSNGSLPVNSSHEDEVLRLDPELVVRINYEKFTVSIRNMCLAELAKSRIGETTSFVYAELLRLLEENIPRCRPDPHIDNIDDLPDGPTITTMELVSGMSLTVNVGAGIGRVPSDKVSASNVKRRRSQGDSEVELDDEDEPAEDARELNGDGESDSHGETAANAVTKTAPKCAKVTFEEKLPRPPEPVDRQDTQTLVKNHLSLLAADDCKFIRRCGSRGQGEWTVDFDRLIHFLQQHELDSIVLENFDTTGHRLTRMMRKMGKMEEKHLATFALMKQKDVRTKLVEMQMAGVADIQEIPKDATRANNRTIFLWHFDVDRVSAIVSQRIYKAMSRCFQRLEVERRRASGILSLIQRSDVKGHLEEVLSGEQMNMLRDIHGREDKLLGQVGRLDDLVGIFSEF